MNYQKTYRQNKTQHEKVKNSNDKIRREKYINNMDPQFTAIDSNSTF